jgi:pimeloyl-ACP methyl ester carboxylesterase
VTLRDGRTLDYWDGGDPDGSPVLLHPGSPSSRLMGVHFDSDARASGVRLVSLSRPGYGGSTLSPPGLASVGRDTVELADLLGIGELGVLGISGGGPYAVAVGALAPAGRVRAVAVAAGVGSGSVGDAADDGASDRFHREAADDLDPLLALDDEAMVSAFFAAAPAGPNARREDPAFRRAWARDLREALRSYDGFVRDNLSWGATWDVDPASSRVPHRLWYGETDAMVPLAQGRWLADRLPDASLTVLEGQGHGAVTFGHVQEMFATLVA